VTRDRWTGPYGVVEQREAEYMAVVGIDPLQRLLFGVLRVRCGSVAFVSDRIETLAWWTGLSPRLVQSALAELAQRGLVRRERSKDSGGPRGRAWRWSTTVLPYDEWPAEPLARSIVSLATYVAVFHKQEHAPDARSSQMSAHGVTPEEAAPHARSSPKSTHEATEEHARDDRRGRTATRHNPASYPDVIPDDVGGQESEADEDLQLLRHVDGFREDRGRYDETLRDFREQRPAVDVTHEIGRWLARVNGQQLHDGPKALAGWLALAKDAPASRRDPRCLEPGCRGRGRGAYSLCAKHLGLQPARSSVA
jgi:hypothetical protein